MPIYKYRAKQGPGAIATDRIEANSKEEAIEKLSQRGLFPLDVELETGAGKTSLSPAARIVLPKKVSIPSRHITVFTRQLASLLKAGVPILGCLRIICDQAENHQLKEVLKQVHDEVKDGKNFSAALSAYPQIFPALYIAMLQVGENSGGLPEALLRIAEYRVKQEEMVGRFKMAMAYPILMALVGMGTIVFMLTFVMPRLMKIFLSSGKPLPFATQALLSLSLGLRQKWFWIGLCAVGFLVRSQIRREKVRKFLSRVSIHLPIFGNLILKSQLARFCRTLEVLLKGGIPILRALDVAIPVASNELIKEKLRSSHKELQQGGSFGRSLKNEPVFPPFMVNLLVVGEESGKLDGALREIANTYEQDTDDAMKVMSNLLEPLIILVMGVIVGFIVVAMLLPIFEINLMSR